ncbi:MAG: hypothetical protein WCI84_04745, partial [Bacteroidota bacterium]
YSSDNCPGDAGKKEEKKFRSRIIVSLTKKVFSITVSVISAKAGTEQPVHALAELTINTLLN